METQYFPEEDTVLFAPLLELILWVVGAAVTLTELIASLIDPAISQRGALSILLTDSICLVLIFLVKRGKIRLVSYLTVVLLWVVATMFVATAGGVHAPSFSAYFLIVFIAGIVLGARAGFVIAAISALTGLGLVYLEQTGRLANSEIQHTPFTFWLVLFSFVLILCVLQQIVSSTVSRSFKRARTELAEREHAEAALQESERKYRQLVETLQEGVMAVDANDKITYANPHLASMLGIPVSEMIGQPYAPILRPRDIETIEKQLEQRRLGRSGQYDVRLVKRDGHILDVSISSSPIKDAQGKYQGAIGCIIDITDHRRAEEKLRESEARYRTLAEASFEGIVISENGVIIDANEQFASMNRYSLSEVIGKNLVDFLIEEEQEMARQALSKGEERISEYHGRRKDGSLFLAEAHGRVFELNGRKLRITSIRDITQGKLAERKLVETNQMLQAIIQASPLAISAIDQQGNLILWSPSAERMFGWKAAEVLGHPLPIIPEDLKEEVSAGIGEELKGRTRVGVEQPRQRKDGSQIVISISTAPLQDETGEITGNMAVCEDVTEKKLAAAKLETSLRQLHALSAHLQTIREEERASIAREIHDVMGQALTGIKMDLFWLKDRIEKQNDSKEASVEVAKMTSMLIDVDKIINLVRQIASELRPSLLDTLGLIPAMEWLTKDFQNRSGTISQFQCSLKNLHPPQDVSIAIFRICQEALTNVARHANAKRVTVRLNQHQKNLVLEVEDNGKGISEEDIHQLTSLGLLGMKERALGFQGTVNFERLEKGGTLVVARFPLP
jgi:PAS domain S-box-containing protein